MKIEWFDHFSLSFSYECIPGGCPGKLRQPLLQSSLPRSHQTAEARFGWPFCTSRVFDILLTSGSLLHLHAPWWLGVSVQIWRQSLSQIFPVTHFDPFHGPHNSRDGILFALFEVIQMKRTAINQSVGAGQVERTRESHQLRPRPLKWTLLFKVTSQNLSFCKNANFGPFWYYLWSWETGLLKGKVPTLATVEQFQHHLDPISLHTRSLI